MKSIKAILEHRQLPLLAAVLGAVLASSSLSNGFLLDDYIHRANMLGSDQLDDFLGGPQEMFRFVRGDAERTRQAMDVGFLPWWTYPDLKGELFRPVTVQTHVLDYALWPDNPLLMHLHSLLWYATLVFLVGLLFRRIFGPSWTAGLATLLFAFEDSHALPVGWLANRNVLLSATFGVACLLAHDRWVQKKKVHWYLLALVLWLASLCSGEAGIATSAFVFAYVVWLQRNSWRSKFLLLLPYGVVLVSWRIIRDRLGYGVKGLGLYVDPLDEPSRFISALVERIPVLMTGQWAFPSADLYLLWPGTVFWWWAGFVTVMLAALFWPMLRADRKARFFATAMLLAAIPICATFPMDRLLTFVGIGAFGLLARFAAFSFSGDHAGGLRSLYFRLARFAVVCLLLMHLAVAPMLLVYLAANPFGPADFQEAVNLKMQPPEVKDQDLIVVNAPFPIYASYYMLIAEFDDHPRPRHLRCLATGLCDMTIRREDDRTIVIRPEAGFNLTFIDQLVRNERHPMKKGEKVKLTGMTAEVLSVSRRVDEVRFKFDVSLEDRSLRWIYWREGKFERFEPPAPGQEKTLKAPPITRIITSDYRP